MTGADDRRPTTPNASNPVDRASGDRNSAEPLLNKQKPGGKEHIERYREAAGDPANLSPDRKRPA